MRKGKKLPKYAYGIKKPVVPKAIEDDPNFNNYLPKEKNNNLTAAQYAGIGTSLAGGAASTYSNFSNPEASIRDKSESLDNTTMGVAGAINPLVGGIIGAVNSIAKPLRTKAEATDEEGNLINRKEAKNMAIIGGLLDPVKALTTRLSYKGGLGDISGNTYLNSLESEAKAKIPQEEEIFDKDYRQDAVWQKLADYQQFAMGGLSNIPNAELEKQEIVRYPDGSTSQVNGPSHQNGGVPVNIPPGTEVFSDRLKLPGSKVTIAQEAKKYKTDKEDKILADSKATSTAKTTAKLVYEMKQRKLNELFQAQEAMKQAKVAKYAEKLGVTLPQVPQFKNGGMKLPKYPNGVRKGNFLNSYKPVFNQITYPGQPYNPYQKSLQPWSVNTSQDTNLISQPLYGDNTIPVVDNVESQDPYTNMRNRNIYEGIGNGLLQNAGNFYDLYLTNMGRDYDKEDYGKINPAYYNPKTLSATEELRDADRQATASRYALRNAIGGNTGAYLANLAANQTANSLNKAKIRESINNTNTSILNDASLKNTAIRNEAERYNLDLKNRAKVDTFQNKARSQDIAREAVRGIGENLSASYGDYKLNEMNQKKLALINQVFPSYKFDPSNFEFYYRIASQTNKPN